MFLVRLVLFPFKLATGTAKVAAKTGYRTGRLFGYRRLVVFGVGVAAGMLLAPASGAELRQRVRSLVESRLTPPVDRGSTGEGTDLTA